jgi:hypothetical protein
MSKYPDKGSAQSTELVLFDQLIKINAEQFECKTQMLSVNLYELIKQNQFRGLSTTLVRVFAQQLLNALTPASNHSESDALCSTSSRHSAVVGQIPGQG